MESDRLYFIRSRSSVQLSGSDKALIEFNGKVAATFLVLFPKTEGHAVDRVVYFIPKLLHR